MNDLVKNIPTNPGVYMHKDKTGKIIYVGKAKNLHNRVSQYFLQGRDTKTAALVRNIASIDFIVTNTEVEALILENNLIKQHQPHYNILLKDAKSFPMIKITDENTIGVRALSNTVYVIDFVSELQYTLSYL